MERRLAPRLRLDFERFIFGRAASLRLGPVRRCVGAPVFSEGDAARPITASQPPGRACQTSKHYRSRFARPLLSWSLQRLSAEKQNEYQGQQEREGHERGKIVCR